MKGKRLPIIILGVTFLAGSLIFLYFNREKLFPQPKETETTTEPLLPEVKTKELTKIEIDKYSLINENSLKNATWEWDIYKKGGLLGNLEKDVEIYMPFDGYVEPYINSLYNTREIYVYNTDKSVKLQILGHFELYDIANTLGTLIKKGTPIAKLDKYPPKNNVWKQTKPFIIIYAYQGENLDPSILKNLFPDIIKE